MNISFTPTAWDDYLWFQQNNKRLVKRINRLINDIVRSPFEGIGKPEPLKTNLSGYWSRRIDGEHRLIYRVSDSEIVFISCRFHYLRH